MIAKTPFQNNEWNLSVYKRIDVSLINKGNFFVIRIHLSNDCHQLKIILLQNKVEIKLAKIVKNRPFKIIPKIHSRIWFDKIPLCRSLIVQIIRPRLEHSTILAHLHQVGYDRGS